MVTGCRSKLFPVAAMAAFSVALTLSTISMRQTEFLRGSVSARSPNSNTPRRLRFRAKSIVPQMPFFQRLDILHPDSNNLLDNRLALQGVPAVNEYVASGLTGVRRLRGGMGESKHPDDFDEDWDEHEDHLDLDEDGVVPKENQQSKDQSGAYDDLEEESEKVDLDEDLSPVAQKNEEEDWDADMEDLDDDMDLRNPKKRTTGATEAGNVRDPSDALGIEGKEGGGGSGTQRVQLEQSAVSPVEGSEATEEDVPPKKTGGKSIFNFWRTSESQEDKGARKRDGSSGSPSPRGRRVGAASVCGAVEKKDSVAFEDHLNTITDRLKSELKLGEEGERLIQQKDKEGLLDLIREKQEEVDEETLQQKDLSSKPAKPVVRYPASLPSIAYDIQKYAGTVREMVDEEYASEISVVLRRHPLNFTKIRLGGKSLGSSASKVFAKALNKCTRISEVDISDCIAGRQEEEALESLETLASAFASHSNITKVSLSDNAMGDKGYRRVRSLLEGRDLISLKLANTGTQAPALSFLKEVLPEGPLSLEDLELQRNLLTTEGGKVLGTILRDAPNLKTIRLYASRITPEGGTGILTGLMASSNLQVLDLLNNNIGKGNVENLAAVLANNPNLKELKIGGCGFVGQNLIRIAHVVGSNNPKMQQLDLGASGIGIVSIGKVLEILKPLNEITHLTLEENHLKTEGAKAIAEAIENGMFPKLTHLNLKDNEIGSIGAMRIAKAVASRGKGFRRLELDCNTISDWTVSEIQALFAKRGMVSDCLGEMDLNDPEMDEDELNKEFASAKVTPSNPDDAENAGAHGRGGGAGSGQQSSEFGDAHAEKRIERDPSHVRRLSAAFWEGMQIFSIEAKKALFGDSTVKVDESLKALTIPKRPTNRPLSSHLSSAANALARDILAYDLGYGITESIRREEEMVEDIQSVLSEDQETTVRSEKSEYF